MTTEYEQLQVREIYEEYFPLRSICYYNDDDDDIHCDDIDSNSDRSGHDMQSNDEECSNSDLADLDDFPAFIKGYQSYEPRHSTTYQNDPDYQIVKMFYEKHCKPTCRRGPDCKPCSSLFTITELMSMRRDCAELDYNDENHLNHLDMLVMGQLRALISTNEVTKSSKRSTQTDRLRTRTNFFVQGWQVCEITFLFSHGISNKRYRKIKNTFLDEGVVEKAHGNSRRSPKKALSCDSSMQVVNFIRGYAEHHAIFLPGRQAAHWDMTLKLLPTSETKRSIYKNVFSKSMEEENQFLVSEKAFYKLWKQCCPEIIIAKPMSDLCKICQKNFTNTTLNATRSEDEIRGIVEVMTSHLANVDTEREFYKSSIARTQQSGGTHLSFDMAQLVSIPHNPFQAGSIYFLCGFKIGIFGIMNDTIKRQHNFLIPESVSISKGSSYTISMLHHYLAEFVTDAQVLFLHADNCSWQNKNNAMMRYLCFRVQTGLSDSIQMSFMPAGHTKFSPDWAFGLLKKKYRISNVNTVQEMADVVEDSTPESRINQSIVVSDEKGLSLNVNFFKWQQYFDDMNWRKIPMISKYAHFYFDKRHPKMVLCKKYLNEEGTLIEIGEFCPNVTLEEEHSSGLLPERQKYLYENVREFCAEKSKDILCPSPTHIEDNIENEETHSTTVKPAPKRGRPKKTVAVELSTPSVQGSMPEKRKRGRPRKENPIGDEQPKKPRGRPRKIF